MLINAKEVIGSSLYDFGKVSLHPMQHTQVTAYRGNIGRSNPRDILYDKYHTPSNVGTGCASLERSFTPRFMKAEEKLRGLRMNAIACTQNAKEKSAFHDQWKLCITSDQEKYCLCDVCDDE